jgi:hypothetical protein
VDRFDFQYSASWGIPDYSHRAPEQEPDCSPEDFLSVVEATLLKRGVWKATWEYRMGGTTRVEIKSSKVEGVRRYCARAAFGGLVTTANYDTLEHALRASSLMAYALANVREQGGWKGLFEG